MEPPSLSTELRKLLLWLTLACFSRKHVQKQIDWTSRIDSFSQKRSKWAWFSQSGRGFKNSRALRTQPYYWNPPLQEILDPPQQVKPRSCACDCHGDISQYMDHCMWQLYWISYINDTELANWFSPPFYINKQNGADRCSVCFQSIISIVQILPTWSQPLSW